MHDDPLRSPLPPPPPAHAHPLLAALADTAGDPARRAALAGPLDLLTRHRAILLLPRHELLADAQPDDAFLQLHVALADPDAPHKLLTLGGLRILVKEDRLFLVGPHPSETELRRVWGADDDDAGEHSTSRRSLFETFDQDVTTTDFPSIEITAPRAHIQLTATATISVLAIARPIVEEDTSRVFRDLSFQQKSDLQRYALDDTADHLETFRVMVKNPELKAALEHLDSSISSFAALEFRVVHEQVSFVKNVSSEVSRIITRRAPGAALPQTFIVDIHYFIASKCYRGLFAPHFSDDAAADSRFHTIVSAINMFFSRERVRELVLGAPLDNSPARDDAVVQAGLELFKLNTHASPAAKLRDLQSCHDRIVGAISASAGEESGADEIMGHLIYTIVRANPPRLISNLRFLLRYVDPAHESGALMYCLTNMAAAVQYLESMTQLHDVVPEWLRNEISSAESLLAVEQAPAGADAYVHPTDEASKRVSVSVSERLEQIMNRIPKTPDTPSSLNAIRIISDAVDIPKQLGQRVIDIFQRKTPSPQQTELDVLKHA